MKKPSITDALLSLIELVVFVVVFFLFYKLVYFDEKKIRKKVVY